ncbi:5-(carboxyamino)imidazole ribonucleotide synthase [uncultured Alistipes sp.]|uniref:5-(carboxyamino)imidazole ribonucleotide synthase n=1 Tax=uncultured Alistipes sp. TaxID=538949 RepID=UPI0025E9D489|nr:5-(carboxyamino)imidazole ribonucleotide synthase [uncultured Alistipes sp.]
MTIGIIGGGQLGLMIAEQARGLGVRTVCLDPAADAPAFRVCDERIVAPFDDAAALEELCRRSDAVTYEFENVPGEILIPLCEKYNIPQGYRPLYDSQDRLREKTNAREHGLRTPRFAAVDDEASLRAAVAELGLPCVLKTRTLGYDGHGQAVLRGEEDIVRALPMLAVPCIAEEFMRFDFEASVVTVDDGREAVCFPVGRNIHRDGILDLCVVPADAGEGLRGRMEAESRRFMRECGYRGILAIEYFVKDGEFYFNEMAPRPHNSAHFTIEGCTTNQFRELVRYLAGMPLERPRLVAPTVMKNILGQDLAAAEAVACESREGVHVHLYGKRESRPKRKMGHITFVGSDAARYAAEWADRFVK